MTMEGDEESGSVQAKTVKDDEERGIVKAKDNEESSTPSDPTPCSAVIYNTRSKDRDIKTVKVSYIM